MSATIMPKTVSPIECRNVTEVCHQDGIRTAAAVTEIDVSLSVNSSNSRKASRIHRPP